MKKPLLIVIVGPTAVGKTKVAIELAKEFKAEIISADSRQFFKELSIGTAKPTEEEQAEAKHHFIDNLSITEEYNASFFEEEVIDFLDTYFKRKNVAILCGGSGMYIDAVVKGFDSNVPTADKALRAELNDLLEAKGIESLQQRLKSIDPGCYDRIDIQNSKRLMRAIEICELTGKPNAEIKLGEEKQRNFNVVQIGLEIDRKSLYEKINKRVDLMLEKGLEEEARTVSVFRDKNALKTVGYKELFDYFDGKISKKEAIDKIKTNSRRYAKRQLTWFKKNLRTVWFFPFEIEKISMYIRKSFGLNE